MHFTHCLDIMHTLFRAHLFTSYIYLFPLLILFIIILLSNIMLFFIFFPFYLCIFLLLENVSTEPETMLLRDASWPYIRLSRQKLKFEPARIRFLQSALPVEVLTLN